MYSLICFNQIKNLTIFFRSATTVHTICSYVANAKCIATMYSNMLLGVLYKTWRWATSGRSQKMPSEQKKTKIGKYKLNSIKKIK